MKGTALREVTEVGMSLLLLLATFTTPLWAEGDTSANKISFNRDVRPLLADRCFTCHGPDENTREGDLRLDARDDAVLDRGGYQAIAPGSPDTVSSSLHRSRSTRIFLATVRSMMSSALEMLWWRGNRILWDGRLRLNAMSLFVRSAPRRAASDIIVTSFSISP